MEIDQIESLRKERDLLRSMINSMPDCHVFLKDRDSRFIISNDYLLKLLGLSSLDEIVGKTDFDFFPRELAEGYFRGEQEIVKTGEPLINWEEKTVDAEQREHWLLTTKVPLFSDAAEAGAEKRVTGIVGLSRNITEIKQYRDDLQKGVRTNWKSASRRGRPNSARRN